MPEYMAVGNGRFFYITFDSQQGKEQKQEGNISLFEVNDPDVLFKMPHKKWWQWPYGIFMDEFPAETKNPYMDRGSRPVH